MNNVGYIQYSEDSTLRLILDTEESGKNRLYFLEGKQRIPKDPSNVVNNNLPFISFFHNSTNGVNTVSIVGMYVPPNKRGLGFSDMMLSQFFDMMDSVGIKIGSTAQIKKPMLAAKLTKIGFTPERSDIIGRIIGVNRENIPIISIDQNTRKGDGSTQVSPKNISSTGKNQFYHVVQDATNSGIKVALQTIYHPPDNVSRKKFIEKNRNNIYGKIRIFQARIKNILNLKT